MQTKENVEAVEFRMKFSLTVSFFFAAFRIHFFGFNTFRVLLRFSGDPQPRQNA